MRFKNFSVWRGRLPHWRADDVTYYVTFRHRRPLVPEERRALLKELSRQDARRIDIVIACVLPDATELLATVRTAKDGHAHELSDSIEKAKAKAGRVIVKKSGERFPPFYQESYDRIIRDAVELEERWNGILESPVVAELVEDPEAYDGLFVCERPVDTPLPSG